MSVASKLWLAIFLIACTHESGPAIVVAARRASGTVIVQVTNRSQSSVLLLSPSTPNRQIDNQRCTVFLSTKVQEFVLPYAFTPDLIELKPGRTATFPIQLDSEFRERCTNWQTSLEYAYVLTAAARPFERQDPMTFRAYVLQHQVIAHGRT